MGHQQHHCLSSEMKARFQMKVGQAQLPRPLEVQMSKGEVHLLLQEVNMITIVLKNSMLKFHFNCYQNLHSEIIDF